MVHGSGQRSRLEAWGLGLTLASAVLFSTLGVLTQLTYDAGATVGTATSGRFLVGASVLWLLVWVTHSGLPSRRQVLAGLALGVAYSVHAWLFSESLARLDAGLVDMLLFTYPALVILGAVALGRDRWSARRALALGAATAGTALVLVGGLDSIDPLGAALALASAVALAGYILTSAGELERTNSILLIALVTTGAATTLTLAGAARNDLSLAAGAPAFALIAVVGLVAIAGMSAFAAGVSRLGPSRASIVSAVQPALTPVLGFLVFADRLGPEQMLGGTLVVSGVVILEARRRSPVARPGQSWLPWWERLALARVSAVVDAPAGTRLFRQGTPADALFVIEGGRAAVVRDGRRVAKLGPGNFFGEIALLRGGARTASVVAATDMRVRVVPRREFARVLQRLPRMARSLQAAASERLHALPLQPATAP